MNYQLRIQLWNLGADEAEELVSKIADLLAERGLGADAQKPEEPIRSVIGLAHASPADGGEPTVDEWFTSFSEEMCFVCIPSLNPHGLQIRLPDA